MRLDEEKRRGRAAVRAETQRKQSREEREGEKGEGSWQPSKKRLPVPLVTFCYFKKALNSDILDSCQFASVNHLCEIFPKVKGKRKEMNILVLFVRHSKRLCRWGL